MNRRVSLASTLETNIKIGSFDSLAVAKQLCRESDLGTPILQRIDAVLELKRLLVSEPQNRELDAAIRTQLDEILKMAFPPLSGPA